MAQGEQFERMGTGRKERGVGKFGVPKYRPAVRERTRFRGEKPSSTGLKFEPPGVGRFGP